MRILWQKSEDEVRECIARVEGAEAVWVVSDEPVVCPCCGWSEHWKEGQPSSIALFSRHSTTGSHTTRGTALCAKCAEPVGGDIVVELDTIFGLDEDQRVLHGRPRVYG